MAILLGTQNWNYRAWIGPFYPPNTKNPDLLRWYGRMFSTLEVDSTFYGVPAEAVLKGWKEKVPDDFVFSLKLPQEITHSRRLVGGEEVLARFVDRVEFLGNSLGPILLQLPPDFLPSRDNRGLVQGFLAKLAPKLRWTIEFRHPGWVDEDTLALLRDRNVALTLVDGRWMKRARMLELASQPTANFTYVRWMGLDRRLTDFSHPQLERDEELSEWAEVLQALEPRVETVFGYFNNQFQGHSPHSVREMQKLLGQETVAPTAVRPQAELF